MMLTFVITGLLIGFFVSMPVGPLAVLCIQRTLNKGRWHGFATALGTAFSDMVYALIAAFGMTFVTAFITSKQMLIQVIGSVVITIFGLYIFRSNPVKKLSPVSSPSNYIQDFITAFLLTFSNPTILFLFIGLYARFNFIQSAENLSFFKIMIGVLAVFAGAIMWWFFLVSIVDFFRQKINVRSLWVVNKLMGSIIALLGILGIVLSITGSSVL